MTPTTPVVVDVHDAELTEAIGTWLAAGPGRASLARLCRQPWEYATSAPLELIVAVTDDGCEHRLVLKHLGRRQATAQVRRVKPSFVLDARREIDVYRQLLAPSGLGAPLVGWSVEPANDSSWLLLKYVPGPRLFEVGELEAWTATARWLGALHAGFASLDMASRRQARLIECDRAGYRAWIDRALRFFADEGSLRSRQGGTALRWLGERYDAVVDHLLSLPSSLIHGEFYPSNVIVTGPLDDALPCVIDWETASVGPGVLDLAALTAGEWSERERSEMFAAYLAGSGQRMTLAELSQSAQYAQLHLAVQWLGWFGRRRAPDLQTRDWLGDAIDRAEALGL